MDLEHLAAHINQAADLLNSKDAGTYDQRRNLLEACENLVTALKTPDQRLSTMVFGLHQVTAIRIAVEMGLFDIWEIRDAIGASSLELGFEDIMKLTRADSILLNREQFVFYDGPPFATGLPHYGHLLVSTIKDSVCRYWAMQGFHVERRFGWDTHGLPIEYEIDKKFGLSGSQAVKEFGLARYNEECRGIVMRYAQEWRETITRLGRWVDFDNDYKTMDREFMESVWWVFKQFFDKGSVYRGFRVMPYSTALATPLSNFETAQNYKDRQDPAVVVGFPLAHDPNTRLLVWTTTPWTLPMNLAIAVNANLTYVKLLDKKSGKFFILHESSTGNIYSDKERKAGAYEVIESFKGDAVVGWKYMPPFPYFYKQFKDFGFVVIADDYVQAGEGVGIVHQAPAYGQEDYQSAQNAGIISSTRLPVNPVDDNGCYTSEVVDFAGQHVKEADRDIITHLRKSGHLIKDSQITHSYPHCPRSDTPLIYRAVSAWFVQIGPIIPQMLETTGASHWVPTSVRDKRFLGWIGNANDWNISRNRYWGTPLPLWVSDDYEEVVCVGSIEELKELSGCKQDLEDIHRDAVDAITIPSRQGKGKLRRVDEVFDCWFESGAMPYASKHYPFRAASKTNFDSTFPADFIVEGLDQTRGWFYTLLALGTHLFGKIPFKNCIVNGIVLAEDGKKMSKRLQNYPDPNKLIDVYGVDALRLYFLNSTAVRGEPFRFKESGVKGILTKILIPLWNSYNFFQSHASRLQNTEGIEFRFDSERTSERKTTNTMDLWILARCQSLIKGVKKEMDDYELSNVPPQFATQIDNMNNWYIRFNRDRFKGSGGTEDIICALNTLFETLLTFNLILAPFAPFITEKIYGLLLQYLEPTVDVNSSDKRSIHFQSFPKVNPKYIDEDIERRVKRMQFVIDLVRVSRERRAISLKTPLKRLVVVHPNPEYIEDIVSLETYILGELNVQELVATSNESEYEIQYSLTVDWPTLGKKLRQGVKQVRNALIQLSSDAAKEMVRQQEFIVDGIHLEAEDVTVKREFRNIPSTLEPNGDGDLLTLLDVASSDELYFEGLCRDVISRFQKLRKRAGLLATQEILMEYQISDDSGAERLSEMFDIHRENMAKTLRGNVQEYDSHVTTSNSTRLILEEECTIMEATLRLRLLRLQ